MKKSLSEAVEKSVKNGIEAGRIDPERDAATIAMLEHMADVLDKDNTKTSSVMRYVSPASFLNYCEKLGFTPASRDADGTPRTDKNAKLHLVGKSKWAKQA